MDDKILDLSSLVPERSTIKFRDDTRVEMKTIDEFGLADRAEIQKLGNEFSRLAGLKEPTEDDIRQSIEVSHKLISILLVDVPEKTVDSLTDREEALILDFFIRRSQLPKARKSTGEK